MPDALLILAALAAAAASAGGLVVAWRIATGDPEVGNLVALVVVAIALAWLLATAGGWHP